MVSSCPRRTWAILTKYDNNRDFVQWADKNNIAIPQYQGVEAYTSNLLDTYMKYKSNIAGLQAVLQSPKGYVMSSVSDAIPITATALVDERKRMRVQMGLIVKEIDTLSVIMLLSHIPQIVMRTDVEHIRCIHPKKVDDIEEKSQIQSPEVWATRLPVCSNGFGKSNISLFNLV